eukprot:100487_1
MSSVSNGMLFLSLFLYLQCTWSEPIFFEVWYLIIALNVICDNDIMQIFGFRTECVFDWFDENEVIQFFYEIRADQDDEQSRTELEIKIMTENNRVLTARRGYQSRINYEISNQGVYKICFEMVGQYYDSTIIGIEMLGLKSESHYHQKELVTQEHINPMYTKVMDIAGTLDEVESLQSASKNWAIKNWDAILYNAEYLGFYAWLQGWVLLIVSICQIRFIRQWFAKVGARLPTKKRGINYRV